MAAPVLDAFNRTNGSVGAQWDGATRQLAYRIAGNRLDVQRGGALSYDASFGASQSASITLATVAPRSREQGVLLKVQQPGAVASGAIAVLYDAVLGRVVVSTLRPSTTDWIPYDGTAATFSDGDRLGACALASGDVRVYKNGALLATVPLNAADQAFFNAKGGQAGVWARRARRALLDDFGGGTVTP
jgi:hypothetical protein